MSLQPFEITFILAALLLTFELATSSFVVVCFSPALLGVAGVEWIFKDFSPLRDSCVFVGLVVLSSLTVRLVFKNKNDSKKVGSDINDY